MGCQRPKGLCRVNAELAPKREWAVLFDLDGTLVESQVLKPLRDAGRWPEVRASFGLSALLPGTLELLGAVSRVAHVGVITMAPRSYAELLLEHHGLTLPVLVAYRDVPRHELKPHPRPILLAAQLLGLHPRRVIYVGDEVRDVVAAHRAGARAIGYGVGDLARNSEAATADAFARDWTEVGAAVKMIMHG
jgi:HAD superfamily hydrolase (TIGR01549 family)